jgi:hypothetical protein
MGNLRPFRRSVARGRGISWDRCRRGRRRQVVILVDGDGRPGAGGPRWNPKPRGIGRRLFDAVRQAFGRRGRDR